MSRWLREQHAKQLAADLAAGRTVDPCGCVQRRSEVDPDIPRDGERRVSQLRGLLFHVIEVFHTRVNLLLVAESIFFAALAAIWKDGDRAIRLTFAGLGVAMTIVLWYANATLYVRSKVLTTKLRAIDDVYDAYLSAVPLPRLSVTALLAHALPAVSLAAWLGVVLQILARA